MCKYVEHSENDEKHKNDEKCGNMLKKCGKSKKIWKTLEHTFAGYLFKPRGLPRITNIVRVFVCLLVYIFVRVFVRLGPRSM